MLQASIPQNNTVRGSELGRSQSYRAGRDGEQGREAENTEAEDAQFRTEFTWGAFLLFKGETF